MKGWSVRRWWRGRGSVCRLEEMEVHDWDLWDTGFSFGVMGADSMSLGMLGKAVYMFIFYYSHYDAISILSSSSLDKSLFPHTRAVCQNCMPRYLAFFKRCRNSNSLLVRRVPSYMSSACRIDGEQQASYAPEDPGVHRGVVWESQMSSAREKVNESSTKLAIFRHPDLIGIQSFEERKRPYCGAGAL